MRGSRLPSVDIMETRCLLSEPAQGRLELRVDGGFEDGRLVSCWADASRAVSIEALDRDAAANTIAPVSRMWSRSPVALSAPAAAAASRNRSRTSSREGGGRNRTRVSRALFARPAVGG